MRDRCRRALGPRWDYRTSWSGRCRRVPFANRAAGACRAVSPTGGDVTFWNWRRGPGPTATQGRAASPSRPSSRRSSCTRADSRIVGWIAPNGQRVTDLLAQPDELRLWRPSPGPLDDTSHAVRHRQGRRRERRVGVLATARVILAMPPEWRASRQLRLHRRLRRAAARRRPVQRDRQHPPPARRRGRSPPRCAAQASCR